jgi:hypothetical protein
MSEQGILSLVLVLVINLSVLYYIWYVSQDKCKCLVDWRSQYIKYYCISIIAINLLIYFFDGMIDPLTRGFVIGTILIAGLIYLYALHTYTHQLDKDNCKCATEDIKYLQNILYYYSYFFYAQAVFVALIALLLLGRIIGLFNNTTVPIKYTKTKKNKKSKK